MSITIELPPHIEARLKADAAEQGRDPATVAAARVAQAYADEDEEDYEPTEEDLRRAHFIREWAEAQKGRGLPAIPLEALRRVNLYERASEDAGLREALNAPARPFDPDAPRRKYGVPTGRTAAELTAAADREIAALKPTKRAQAERLGLI